MAVIQGVFVRSTLFSDTRQFHSFSICYRNFSLLPLLLLDKYVFRQTHFFAVFAIFRHENEIWEIFRSRIRASRVLTDPRSTFLEFYQISKIFLIFDRKLRIFDYSNHINIRSIRYSNIRMHDHIRIFEYRIFEYILTFEYSNIRIFEYMVIFEYSNI